MTHRVIRFVIGVLLAPILPPAAVFITCGAGTQLGFSVAVAALGLAVFKLLFAGPGLIIWGLGACHAIALSLRSLWKR